MFLCRISLVDKSCSDSHCDRFVVLFSWSFWSFLSLLLLGFVLYCFLLLSLCHSLSLFVSCRVCSSPSPLTPSLSSLPHLFLLPSFVLACLSCALSAYLPVVSCRRMHLLKLIWLSWHASQKDTAEQILQMYERRKEKIKKKRKDSICPGRLFSVITVWHLLFVSVLFVLSLSSFFRCVVMQQWCRCGENFVKPIRKC